MGDSSVTPPFLCPYTPLPGCVCGVLGCFRSSKTFGMACASSKRIGFQHLAPGTSLQCRYLTHRRKSPELLRPLRSPQHKFCPKPKLATNPRPHIRRSSSSSLGTLTPLRKNTGASVGFSEKVTLFVSLVLLETWPAQSSAFLEHCGSRTPRGACLGPCS